jgi:hypothetical protein
MITLTRNQIRQLYEFVLEYEGDDERVQIRYSDSSGIGTNMYASIKYASGTREAEIDITDYENW